MLTFNETIPSLPYLEVGRLTEDYAAFNSAQIMKSVSAGSYNIIIASTYSYDETAYLLSTKANRKALQDSEEQLEKGESIKFSSIKDMRAYFDAKK